MLPADSPNAMVVPDDQIVEKEASPDPNFDGDVSQFVEDNGQPGGITDQEILDQLQRKEPEDNQNAQDKLRDRIITTLNSYNSVREKAS